jgi:hypothetical protein
MGYFSDLLGTTAAALRIGVTGLNVKSVSGKLRVRNTADSADAPLVGSVVAASGDSIEINEDAAGTGADRKYTLSRPVAGMTTDVSLTLPTSIGAANQVLSDNGSGQLVWQTVASGADKGVTDNTALSFGSASPVSMFNLPANAVVKTVTVVVDTPFNGTPSLSIGITGTTSKYMPATGVDLTAAAKVSFDAHPDEPPVGGIEALIATYSAGGATVGSARILVDYVVPG